MNRISLPCLRGVIGDWTFFSTIMKIKNIVTDYRIITVSESEELYTHSINEVLQREINEKRIEKIKDYLLNNAEHFFSSIIVAIHNGNPIWSDFDIETHFRIENEIIENEEDLNFIENKLGVLTLSGEEEVPIILVVHKNNLKERTRRLFTVLNKYAQKPNEAELIIIDEDDVSSIITRKLLETHPILSLDNAISDSNSANLSSTDYSNFSTLVIINRINKIILKENRINYTMRPNDDLIGEYYNKVVLGGNYFFEVFPITEQFIRGGLGENRFPNGDLITRNRETGGSLLLRPVGQMLFAETYILFSSSKEELEILKEKLQGVDSNLNGSTWKYVFWNNKMLAKNDALKRNILFYLLGKYKNENIHNEIRGVLNNYGVEYQNRISPV
jgi:DNA sulfur modification protein DndB